VDCHKHSLLQRWGGSKRTLEKWEQGRRKPSGAAKQLLKIADRHPEVLIEVAA
jgi:putative transcriptional regulator